MIESRNQTRCDILQKPDISFIRCHDLPDQFILQPTVVQHEETVVDEVGVGPVCDNFGML